MTTIKQDDGSEILYHVGDDPTFEVKTWCSDTDGKVPEQVHLVLHLTPNIKVMYRFTGPVVLTRFIEALVLHRETVWPDQGGNRP